MKELPSVEQIKSSSVWVEMSKILQDYLDYQFPGVTVDDLVFTAAGNHYTISYNETYLAEIHVSVAFSNSFLGPESDINLN